MREEGDGEEFFVEFEVGFLHVFCFFRGEACALKASDFLLKKEANGIEE